MPICSLAKILHQHPSLKFNGLGTLCRGSNLSMSLMVQRQWDYLQIKRNPLHVDLQKTSHLQEKPVYRQSSINVYCADPSLAAETFTSVPETPRSCKI